MEQKHYPKDSLISKEGEQSDGMFVVKTGKVEVFKVINGDKVILSQIGPNDFFGEMSLFLSAPRTANVRAMQDSDLLFLKKEDLLDQIKNQPDLAVMMLSRLSKRLKEAHDVIAKLEGEKKALELIHR